MLDDETRARLQAEQDERMRLLWVSWRALLENARGQWPEAKFFERKYKRPPEYERLEALYGDSEWQSSPYRRDPFKAIPFRPFVPVEGEYSEPDDEFFGPGDTEFFSPDDDVIGIEEAESILVVEIDVND
jgi:hypothetical protein